MYVSCDPGPKAFSGLPVGKDDTNDLAKAMPNIPPGRTGRHFRSAYCLTHTASLPPWTLKTAFPSSPTVTVSV